MNSCDPHMNLRRVLVAQLWKRACSTVAGPPSVVVETTFSRSKKRANPLTTEQLDWKYTEKRMMFLKLLHLERTGLTLEETLNKFSDDEQKKRRRIFVVTKTDLYSWAKLLHKECKHRRDREIFEWMESKNMSLTGYKLAFYIELIAKTKSFNAAYSHFRKIEPTIDYMDFEAKNRPALLMLSKLEFELDEKSHLGLNFRSCRYAAPVHLHFRK